MDSVFILITLVSFFGALIFFALWIVSKIKKSPSTYGKKAGISLLVCIVSYIGFGVVHVTKPSVPPAQETNKSQEKPQEASSVDSILSKAAEHGVSSYGGTLVKYKDINVTQHVDGSYFIIVNCNGTILPDKSGTLKEYKIAAAYVMKDVFGANTNLNGCTFAVWSNVVEKKTGREENHNVYGITVKKDAADKINWSNVDSIDITKIAETEKILPPLR